MKIEIGESLMLSYLKHVKKCLFYQANWKVSSNWHSDDISSDKVSFSYNNIIKHSEFSDIFKASKLEQLIKQSEIDVIGWDGNDKIYAADIAFHEAGLNYGSKIETKNRVLKKLLRSYLTLLAYFPNKKYELIFASPKVHKDIENMIKDGFKVLNNNFSEENVTFRYISNDVFRDEILFPAIEKTENDSDTNELFIRAIKLSNMFEMISNGKEISTQQEIIHTSNGDERTNNDKLLLEFIPNDKKKFKQELIRAKKAKRTWYYKDKSSKTDIWDASKLTMKSGLENNIRSNNKARRWKETGLIKIKFEI